MGPPRTYSSLKSLLAAQLGTCITALKAGKQDQVLRMSSFIPALFIIHVHFVFFSLQLSLVAMTFGMRCLIW
jgi:hypothetical protein